MLLLFVKSPVYKSMCLVYRKIKHNPPEFNGSRMYTFTPCGKCEDCLNHSRYAWAWRLTSDIQYYVKEKGYRVGIYHAHL